MKNNDLRTAAIAALLVSLSACGGGGMTGGSGVQPIAAPPPAPPPPPPTGDALLSSGQSTSLASSQTLELDHAQTATTNRSVTDPGLGFSVSYDAAAGTYTVATASRQISFSPSDLDQKYGPGNMQHGAEIYAKHGAAETDFLLFLRGFDASPPMDLHYANYGAWQHNTNLGDRDRIEVVWFTYGIPTTAADMPRTGSATYRLIGAGNYAEASHLYVTQETGDLTADFAAGRINFNMIVTGNDFLQGWFGGIGGFTGSAPISSTGFEGALDSSNLAWSGKFKGQFYGPGAPELGFVYSATSPSATLNGAVLGLKK